MSLPEKLIRTSSLLGACALATAFIVQPADAAATPVEATAALQAVAVTKTQAESIALHAVGGGTVLLAVLEREDQVIHWSVDITGPTAEYEVWVSTRGKVLKIVAQPL